MEISLRKYRWRMLLLGLIYGYFTAYLGILMFEDKIAEIPLVIIASATVLIMCIVMIYGPKTTISYYLKAGVVPDIERELQRLGYTYAETRGRKRYYFKKLSYLFINMATITTGDNGLRLDIKEPFDNIFRNYCARYSRGLTFRT